jgi:hypothetical protein
LTPYLAPTRYVNYLEDDAAMARLWCTDRISRA